MKRQDAEIIVKLADNGLDISPTGRALFLHPNTVKYHIRKIHRETGKNPRDFYDMCELLPQAKMLLLNGVDSKTMKALEAMGRKAHGEEPYD